MIKVILEEGIVQSVLSDDPNVQVEIVDITKGYDDSQQRRDYAEELYQDPQYKEIPFVSASFTEGE